MCRGKEGNTKNVFVEASRGKDSDVKKVSFRVKVPLFDLTPLFIGDKNDHTASA